MLIGGKSIQEYALGVFNFKESLLAYRSSLLQLPAAAGLLLPAPHRDNLGYERNREPDTLHRYPPRLGPHHQITGWHTLDLVQSVSDALSHLQTSMGMPLSLGG